jgi:hypothetical protein
VVHLQYKTLKTLKNFKYLTLESEKQLENDALQISLRTSGNQP